MPEFKQLVVETMREERLSVCETMRMFEINDHDIIKRWEQKSAKYAIGDSREY